MTTARSVFALVPAKDFAAGKSRLQPALADAARARFARDMFDHVLGTLVASQAVDGIIVVTDSSTVAAAAKAHGASVRPDVAMPGAASRLAAVIDAGLRDLRHVRAALVLMADLPLITPQDVQQLLAHAENFAVVAVRAEDGAHTNALVLSPPGCMRTQFGRADSFDAHLKAAEALGLKSAVVDSPRLAFDVDAPADHARFERERIRSA